MFSALNQPSFIKIKGSYSYKEQWVKTCSTGRSSMYSPSNRMAAGDIIQMATRWWRDCHTLLVLLDLCFHICCCLGFVVILSKHLGIYHYFFRLHFCISGCFFLCCTSFVYYLTMLQIPAERSYWFLWLSYDFGGSQVFFLFFFLRPPLNSIPDPKRQV